MSNPINDRVRRTSHRREHRWAIVLAAGEGTRLRATSRDLAGRPIPKQYWSPDGGPSLLQRALVRADRLVPRERVVVVVAAAHEHWWRRALEGRLPPENIIVQPRNRGTAAGILLPLSRILARDPAARVVVLPSDHAVVDEWILTLALENALAGVEKVPDRLILLGMAQRKAEPGLGWIVPRQSPLAGGVGACAVRRFIEKPPIETAASLLRAGALVSSFLFAADARTLDRLFRAYLPELCARFAELDPAVVAKPGPEAEAAYATVPGHDFSADLLAPAVSHLDVLPVVECGWTDLGTPERVIAWRSATGAGAGAGAAVRGMCRREPPMSRGLLALVRP